MIHTTLETLTSKQIHNLKAEALAHGDQDMAEVCARALLGCAADRQTVVVAINAAEAMDDEAPVIKWAEGAGPIDGYDEETDMRRLVSCCDLYLLDQSNTPDAAFWSTYARRERLLERTATKLRIKDVRHDELEPMYPLAIRICASWLLSN